VEVHLFYDGIPFRMSRYSSRNVLFCKTFHFCEKGESLISIIQSVDILVAVAFYQRFLEQRKINGVHIGPHPRLLWRKEKEVFLSIRIFLYDIHDSC